MKTSWSGCSCCGLKAPARRSRISASAACRRFRPATGAYDTSCRNHYNFVTGLVSMERFFRCCRRRSPPPITYDARTGHCRCLFHDCDADRGHAATGEDHWPRRCARCAQDAFGIGAPGGRDCHLSLRACAGSGLSLDRSAAGARDTATPEFSGWWPVAGGHRAGGRFSRIVRQSAISRPGHGGADHGFWRWWRSPISAR